MESAKRSKAGRRVELAPSSPLVARALDRTAGNPAQEKERRWDAGKKELATD